MVCSVASSCTTRNRKGDVEQRNANWQELDVPIICLSCIVGSVAYLGFKKVDFVHDFFLFPFYKYLHVFLF
jgi:hypothetical protein